MQTKLKIQITVNKVEFDGLRLDKCYIQENVINYESGDSKLDISHMPPTIHVQAQLHKESKIEIQVDREYLSCFNDNRFYCFFMVDNICYELRIIFDDSKQMTDCQLAIWENMIDKAEGIECDRCFSMKDGNLTMIDDSAK